MEQNKFILYLKELNAVFGYITRNDIQAYYMCNEKEAQSILITLIKLRKVKKIAGFSTPLRFKVNIIEKVQTGGVLEYAEQC